MQMGTEHIRVTAGKCKANSLLMRQISSHNTLRTRMLTCVSDSTFRQMSTIRPQRDLIPLELKTTSQFTRNSFPAIGIPSFRAARAQLPGLHGPPIVRKTVRNVLPWVEHHHRLLPQNLDHLPPIYSRILSTPAVSSRRFVRQMVIAVNLPTAQTHS